MSPSCTSASAGFRPGSLESIKALQMEHRYEGQLSAAQQAACIPAGLGRRNLAHNVEAQIAERSDQELRRLLAGRRSAAALQWLLKRQQERSRSEHDLFKPKGRTAGVLHQSRTSPDNPLFFNTDYNQMDDNNGFTPAEMAEAMAQLKLLNEQAAAAAAAATANATTSSDTAAAAAPAAAAPADGPGSAGSASSLSSPPSSSSGSSAPETSLADGPAAAAPAQQSQLHLQDGDDAVAVIADEQVPCLPLHMCSHLQTGSLCPEALQGPTGAEAEEARTVMHAAEQEAYWKEQELDDLVSALLREYPHGIPRKMIIDLRQLGITDIPALGYGCPSSSLAHDSMVVTKD